MFCQENKLKQASGHSIRAGSLTRTPSQSKFNGSTPNPKPEFSESERQLISNYLQNSGKSKLSSIVNQIKAKTPTASESSNKFPIHGRKAASKYTQESPFKPYEISEDNSENKENRPNKGNIIQTVSKPPQLKTEKVLVAQASHKQHQGEEIKAVIKKIFMFYASFGDRLNSDHIKANKVHKMMHDSLILDEDQLNKTSLDLVFCRYNKSRPNMSFTVFLSMLVNISQIKFPEQDTKQAFTKLFDVHLKPLYDNLYTETDVGDYERLFKEPFDQMVLEVLNQARGTLQKIHQVYFPLEYQIKSENSENQQLLKHKTDNCLSSFLKDFEICPKLLTNSTAYALYVDVLDTGFFSLAHNPEITTIIDHDIGHKFTFAKFLAYIARLAIIGYSKNTSNQDGGDSSEQSNSDKLLSLLGSLELSSGYVSFEKQLNLTHNHTTRLLPNRALLKRQTEGTGEYGERGSFENQQSRMQRTPSEMSLMHKFPRSGSFASPQARLSAFRPSNEPVCSEVFERKRNFLFKLFQDYASANGNANNYKLKSIKFLKMLKNAELLQENVNVSHQNTPAIKAQDKASQLSHTPKQVNRGGNQTPVIPNPTTKIKEVKRTISTTDLDLIFIKVSGSNKEGLQKSNSELNFETLKGSFTSPKVTGEESRFLLSNGKFLDFGQFLKALELIAEKLYPEYNLDVALTYLIEAHLSRVGISSNATTETTNNVNAGIKRLVSLLKDNQLVEVLAKLKESLHPYFSFYADQAGCMNFDCFMKFCKDFCIFPDMFSRTKLMQLFYNLATLHPLLYQKSQGRNSHASESFKQAEESNYQVIDENLFTEALALCATEIEDNILIHPIEKILYLLEKMAQSPGPVKILKLQKNVRTLNGSYFEVIDYIKKKCSRPSGKSAQKSGTKSEIDFSQIFS